MAVVIKPAPMADPAQIIYNAGTTQPLGLCLAFGAEHVTHQADTLAEFYFALLLRRLLVTVEFKSRLQRIPRFQVSNLG